MAPKAKDKHHLIPRSRLRGGLPYPKKNIIKIDYEKHHCWHDIFTNLLPHEALMVFIRIIAESEDLGFMGSFTGVIVDVNMNIFYSKKMRSYLSYSFENELGRSMKRVRENIVNWRFTRKRKRAFEKIFTGLTPVAIAWEIINFWSPRGYYKKVVIQYEAENYIEKYSTEEGK